MATPAEWHQWRKAAEAAGNHEDVAAIDAELAKLGGQSDRALDDWTPVLQMYADLKTAKAKGLPKEVIDNIQAHIDDFDKRMDLAAERKRVEEMGAGERFVTGLGRGLENVWSHAKEVAHQVVYPGGEEGGWGPFLEQVRSGQPFPISKKHEGEAEYWAKKKEEREAFNQKNLPLSGTMSGFLGNVGGEALGTAPIAAAALPAGPVMGGALAGAGTGALMAEPGERLMGAAIGGTIGGIAGAGQKGAEIAGRGGLEISPHAKALHELGVTGMTAGQMAPESELAAIEAAAENTPGGAIVKARRSVLPHNWQERVLKEAEPPGFVSKLEKGADVPDRLAEMRQAYHEGFSKMVGKEPVPKNTYQNELMDTVQLPNIERALTPEERALAENYVLNQASRLDEDNSFQTLHSIRSNLYRKADTFAKAGKWDLADHLRDVADQASDQVERWMKADPNPHAYDNLRSLEKSYHNFLTVEDAFPLDRAGPDITPAGLDLAVRRGMTRRTFAEGGGGTLRELARAGKYVMAEPRPTTGAMAGRMFSVPKVGPFLVSAAGLLSSGSPRLALGETAPQRVLQYTLGHPVVGGGTAHGVRTAVLNFLRGRPGLHAEDLLQTTATGLEEPNAP